MCLRGIILLLLTYGITSECMLVDKRENITEYLNRRMKESKVDIAKSYMESHRKPVVTWSYNTTRESLWSESLHSEGALTIPMFNKMCILNGDRVMSIDFEIATNDKSSRLRQVSTINQQRSVTFIKSIVWKTNLYLLVCHDDNGPSCSFYTGKNDLQLRHRQIIRHQGRPIDATFFTMKNRLYLVVAYRSDLFPVPSIIYHWTGTYMDIVEKIPMVGAVAVTAFNYKSWIIIVFGQNEKTQPDIGSGIYKYSDNGIEKKQYLPTNGPISIKHYNYQGSIWLLILNERASSNLYWWDGNELLPWFDFDDIMLPKLVKFVDLRDETLYFVAYETYVSLYSVTINEYERLDLLKLENGEKVIDMGVWIEEKTTLTLLLVTFDIVQNLYRIETWELRIKKIDKNARIIDDVGSTEKCLSELHVKLIDRMKPIENIAHRTWPTLVSSAKNITADALGNRLEKLILHSGRIEKLDIFTENEILLASEMKALADSKDSPGSRIIIDKILDKSRKTVRIDQNNRLMGKIIVRNNAEFENLHTNAIDTKFLNGMPAEIENMTISGKKNQTFSESILRGKNVTVRNLEIDRICGLPRNYWLKNKKFNEIFVNNNAIQFINDSVLVQTDLLSFEYLDLEILENIPLKSFFNNLFVIGERQIITGNIKQSSGTLSTNNLVIEELNGVSTNNLITREKNQHFENSVFVKKMSIENLIVDKVNDISASESAMVSKKNHIAGQVTIATLRVLGELEFDSKAKKISNMIPVQVYDDVTLVGRIKAKNLALAGSQTHFTLFVENNSEMNEKKIDSIETIIKSHWTKSTDQTIENAVTFDSGLSIDRLTTKYLNNLEIEEDVLFTSAKEISQFSGSLEFENLIVDGSIIEDSSEVIDSSSSNKLYEMTDDTLYFNQELRIERLGIEQLSIKNFNGIPIDEIMKRRNISHSKPYVYDQNTIQRFDSITINDRLDVENLNLRYVNEADELSFDTLLRFDDDYKLEHLESSRGLTFSGDITFVSGISSFIKKSANYSFVFEDSFIIEGDLQIDGDLQVSAINTKTTDNYLDHLSRKDLVMNSQDDLIIDKLIVRHDFQLHLLHYLHIDSLPMKTFSRSREQNLTDARFMFFKVSADNLQTKWINTRYTPDFVYIDSYDINFKGNVTFTNLTVSLDNDIQTKYLNGYKINELNEKLSTIDRSVVDKLTVRGDVFWESQSSSLKSKEIGPLESIIKNGLVQGKETSPLQKIRGETRIESSDEKISGVFAHHVEYRSNNSDRRFLYRVNDIDLQEIINESVLDDSYSGNEIRIIGKTNFGEDLKTSHLNVDGEIGIDTLNTRRIDDLKSSIVRIDSLNSMIDRSSTLQSSSVGRPPRRHDRQERTMIFTKDITIQKLIIQNGNGTDLYWDEPRLDGVPIRAIVLSSNADENNEFLPNNTHFDHLEVHHNIVVKSLDSVNFDEFVNDRVTLSRNHEVHGNVRFNEQVFVTGNAIVGKINGIDPSDLVINYSHEDQVITGDKIFHGDIATYGKTYAPRIGGIDFTEEYENSVFNHEPVDIIGDITFQAYVQTSGHHEIDDGPIGWKLSDNSFVNEIRLKSLTTDRDSYEGTFFRNFIRNESRLEDSVGRAVNATNNLPEIFYYFETEENLMINVPGVDRVEYIRVEDLTILNMYAKQLGRHCGLADNCPCRKQYTAEISSNDCQIFPVEDPRRIIYNFHPESGAFGINVATTTVSSSERCTNGESLPSEFTTISWMQISDEGPGRTLGGNITREALKIYGYLSDVRVFTQNDLVFIVLAIYYDPINRSHETNSLIYALHLANNDITLVQKIPTNYATQLEVFKIPGKGVHILFAGFSENEQKATAESLLYRFQPNTLKFELLRSFSSGGNRHAQSIAQAKDEFLLLDDVGTNSINVYLYDRKMENFYHHQSLYPDSMSPITSIETFYAGEYRYSQVYVVVTTEHDQFFLYEYMFIGGFQLIAQKRVNGILAMIPFDVSSRRYVLLGTDTNSTVLRIIEQGRH